MSAHVIGPHDAALDRISITGIEATGYHGVFESERETGQPFIVDLVLHVDTRAAAETDELSATVDYGAVATEVEAVITGPAVSLIETLAQRIAQTVLAHAGVQAVDVTVHKPRAPISVPFSDVTVQIRRTAAALIFDGEAAASVFEPADGPVQQDGAADILNQPPAQPVPAVLALGSNQGAAQETLIKAIGDLHAVSGIEVRGISPLARTAPVGGPEQPDFLNCVITVSTTLSPRALLAACHAVEALHGRERLEHWGPRTLDIDLIVYDSVVAASDDLEIPHPRAHQRAFVLTPWAQLEPEAVLPGLGGGPVAALAQTAPDSDGIRWLSLDWYGTP